MIPVFSSKQLVVEWLFNPLFPVTCNKYITKLHSNVLLCKKPIKIITLKSSNASKLVAQVAFCITSVDTWNCVILVNEWKYNVRYLQTNKFQFKPYFSIHYLKLPIILHIAQRQPQYSIDPMGRNSSDFESSRERIRIKIYMFDSPRNVFVHFIYYESESCQISDVSVSWIAGWSHIYDLSTKR